MLKMNNTEFSQLNSISHNNMLSFNKLHSYCSSATSLSYVESYFTFMYKPLDKRSMNTEINVHMYKVVSKEYFYPLQLIQP